MDQHANNIITFFETSKTNDIQTDQIYWQSLVTMKKNMVLPKNCKNNQLSSQPFGLRVRTFFACFFVLDILMIWYRNADYNYGMKLWRI